MSGTGESTGDFDDDQRGFVSEPDASPETAFVEAAAGTAITDVASDEHTPDVADTPRSADSTD